jgi:hypothetical protein
VPGFETPIFELIDRCQTQFLRKFFLSSDFFHSDVTNMSGQLTSNQQSLIVKALSQLTHQMENTSCKAQIKPNLLVTPQKLSVAQILTLNHPTVPTLIPAQEMRELQAQPRIPIKKMQRMQPHLKNL